MPASTDVAIVGAGMAGLAAAEQLGAAGRTVVVLEARERIGGRAWTDIEALGVPFDLGAQWIHAAPQNPLLRLVRERGFATARHKPDVHFRCGGRDYDVAESRVRFEAAVRGAGDVAVASVFPEAGVAERLIAGLECTVICGTDSDRMSALDWSTMIDDSHGLMLPEGLGSFVRAYADSALANADLQLACPVVGIDWHGPRPRLTTPTGTLEAETVLVTVPTGVLAAGGILFDPPLPDWKRDAIEGLPMGLLNKLAFRLDEPVDGLENGDHITLLRDDGAVATCLSRPLGLPYIIVFVGGRFAAALEAEGPKAAQAYGREVVREALGSTAVRRITAATTTAWAAEPWSRGAYATARPGCFACRADLARPVDNRLFFAGEATESIWAAQLAGAWLSGRRAADEIAAVLSPGHVAA